MPLSHTSDAADHTGDYTKRVREALEPFHSEFPVWEKEGHLPRRFFAAMGEAGLLRDRWRDGPAGGHHLARALLAELAPLNAGAALALSIHSEVFVHALARFGGETHRDLLEGALDGRVIGCFGATEPGGGSDLPGLRAWAEPAGDGWHLRAEKRYITNAGRATHALVLARTDPGHRGPCLFCVPLDRPGVTVRGFFETLGVRSADTTALSIDTVLEPTDLVGRRGAGLLMTLTLLDFERLAAAAALVAGAEGQLRLAAAWARRREQFGSRLFDHQALRHRLADRWAEIYAARAALEATCARLGDPVLPHARIAASKLLAAGAASRTADETLQILGARGYTTAYPAEQAYRDVRLTRIGGGTDEMMREIVSASLDTADAEMTALLDRYEAADIPAAPGPRPPTGPDAT